MIMNINIWQPQEKRIKMQRGKLFWWMICGSLWIFAQSRNGRMRFLFKAAALSISYLYYWGKILPDIWSGDIQFSPGLAQIWSRPNGHMLFGLFVCLCWSLTSQSTIFQSYRDGATASWVINQYFWGVKCLAQGHNTAAVGLEPPTSRSGVRHSTTEPPRSPHALWEIQFSSYTVAHLCSLSS